MVDPKESPPDIDMHRAGGSALNGTKVFEVLPQILRDWNQQ